MSTDLLVFAAVLAGIDVLVSQVNVIFAQIVPDFRTGPIQMTAIITGLAAFGYLFALTSEGDIYLGNVLFFLVLLTLLETLLDRFRQEQVVRGTSEASRRIGDDPPGLAVAGADGPFRR